MVPFGRYHAGQLKQYRLREPTQYRAGHYGLLVRLIRASPLRVPLRRALLGLSAGLIGIAGKFWDDNREI